MALSFPNSPTNGQLYTDTTSGNRWVWDDANTVWTSTSTFTQTITVSSTQPGSPVVGQLWWNQDYGRLFVYYNDGNTSQWVEANPADYTSSLAYGVANSAYGRANTALQNTSVTLAGDLTVTGNVAVKANTLSINNVNVSPYGMMKNRIINGDMRIDQRFAGAANNNYGTQYVIDRWAYTSYPSSTAYGKLRYQQNNTNGPNSSTTQISTGFRNFFGANVVSANTLSVGDYWIVGQYIEGLNAADLNWGSSVASPATLSFWVYSSVPGTHGLSIGSLSDLTAYPVTYNINTANTWEYKTITIPPPPAGTSWHANTLAAISVFYSLGVGSNYNRSNTFTWGTTNTQWPTGCVSVVSNANGSFYLTGVQFEKGPVATSWDWRHYTTELQLCQRYYYKSESSVAGLLFHAQGTGTTVSFVQHPVRMRTTPVAAFTGSWGWTINGGEQNAITPSSATGDSFISQIEGSTSGLSNGIAGRIRFGSYSFSAELGVSN